MITGAHCEGANNKVKTIIQDNGCLLFYHALKWLKISGRVSFRGLGSKSLKTVYSKSTRTTLPQKLTISTLDQNKRSYKLKQKSVRELFLCKRKCQKWEF